MWNLKSSDIFLLENARVERIFLYLFFIRMHNIFYPFYPFHVYDEFGKALLATLG